MKIYILKTLLFVFFLSDSINITAQENKLDFHAEYSTEVQSDFGSKFNWLNLLVLQAEFAPWNNGSLVLQTISTYKTQDESIIGDLQTFSNLEVENTAINLFLAGYTHTFGSFSIFGGIRNVGQDYFTEEYTALFTNSSAGIYPTLSFNHPLANYPLSGMSIHAEYKISNQITLKNSLYNGRGGDLLNNNGHGSVFSVNPSRDGVINITELSYKPTSIRQQFYNIGAVVCNDDNSDKDLNYTFWGSVEQSVYNSGKKEIGILLQGSYAPRHLNESSNYYGLGTVWKGFISSKHSDYLGAFINHAICADVDETAIELTCQYGLNSHFTLQPAFHYIITGKEKQCAGLIRFTYTM